MRLGLRSVGTLLGLCVLAGASGCDGESLDDARAVRTLVGQVDDDLFVAMVSDDRDLVLYACDGTADEVTVVEWFHGAHEDGSFDLPSKDSSARAVGSFDLTTGSGALLLQSGTVDFTLEATTTDDAGLYFDQVDVGDDENWGGWIVRNDGSLRGSVINRRTGGLVAAGNATPGAEVTVNMLDFTVLRLETTQGL